MAKHVIIDKGECMGCEVCVSICPEVFGFDDENQVAFVKDPDGAEEDAIEEAMDSCPASCIVWDE